MKTLVLKKGDELMIQTKRNISKVLFGLALSVSVASTAFALTIEQRMEKVKDVFTNYGADAFKVLNGQDIGGAGTKEGKGNPVSMQADIGMAVNDPDRDAFVFCVEEGKWAVYPIQPDKVGTNAMTATDANGVPFVNKLITALRNSSDRKASRIAYTVATPDGRKQEREATVWGSSALLNRKNATGKKFFCGTSVKAHP